MVLRYILVGASGSVVPALSAQRASISAYFRLKRVGASVELPWVGILPFQAPLMETQPVFLCPYVQCYHLWYLQYTGCDVLPTSLSET